jgi:alanyl-tRNA synthetase
VETLQSGVIVLAADGEEKRPMVAKVSDDLVKKGLHAGKLLGEIAKMAGGGGGGRADFAQASAGDPALLEAALKQVKALVQQKLNL